MPLFDPGNINLNSLRRPTRNQGREQERLLDQLLKEAQLSNLQAQPGIENRRLDLTERGQNIGAEHDAITEELTRLGIITVADTTAKGQKGESDRAALSAKTSTTNTLIAHILGRQDIPTDVAAETFRNLGAPAFADALGTAHRAKVDTIAPRTLQNIQALTDPAARKLAIGEAFKDADIKKALLTLDPGLEGTPLGPPSSLAPGSKTPGYNPNLRFDKLVPNLVRGGTGVGAAIANKTFIPVENTLRSVTGLAPVQRAEPIDDFNALLKKLRTTY